MAYPEDAAFSRKAREDDPYKYGVAKAVRCLKGQGGSKLAVFGDFLLDPRSKAGYSK